VIFHPTYSPGTASSYFHIFRGLKNKIRGATPETKINVFRAVRIWLREQDNAWYRQGIYTHTFVPHWHKAVEVDVDFVEK
jgi:hypothetical protein